MQLATLVYLRKDGRTLMLHRNRKPDDMHEGLWNGLGGKFEEGETPEACAIREVKEEAGLIIEEPALRGLLTFPENVRWGESWYVFVYEATEFAGELMTKSREGDLAWIDDGKLYDLPLNEGDYVWMPWLLERKFFSARFTYDDRKLTDWSVVFHDDREEKKGKKER